MSLDLISTAAASQLYETQSCTAALSSVEVQVDAAPTSNLNLTTHPPYNLMAMLPLPLPLPRQSEAWRHDPR
jgi:hypothetical protein